MTVDVYNAKSAAARAIFARKSKDDILETQIECTAVVDVPDSYESSGWAFFDEEYQGPGQIRRPFLVIQGSVSELFIEDSDNRVFPCGAKRLFIKDFDRDKKESEKLNSIPVRVNWRLSSDELSYLFSIGLAYSDFKPPELLRGNKLEIPVNVIYKAVYESPICAVDIVEPDKLETSTLYNRYDTMFMNCEPSQQLIAEKENGGVAIKLNYSDIVPIMDFQTEDVSDVIEIPDDTPVVQAEEVDPVLTPEEMEDEADNAEIRGEVHMAADEYAAIREQQSNVDVSEILEEIHNEVSSEDEDDGFYDDRRKPGTLRLSDKIAMLKAKTAEKLGEDGSTTGEAVENAEIITDMTNYDVSDESTVEHEHAEAEKDAEEQRERMRNIDRVRDNQALNAGIDDISGFGAAEVSPDEDEDEDKRKKIRNVDTALDNQALNSGSSDISGFGARNNLAQGLLSRVAGGKKAAQQGGDLMPSAPVQDDSQRYL